MTRLSYKTMVLLLLGILLTASFARVGPVTSVPSQLATGPSIPLQSDDGQDPVTLIFTGYAPSWWVAANVAGWSDTAYCSGPKAINGSPYNYTLEHPDPSGLPCYGPRDHLRIWDMGYSPVFGVWSIGSAHHEHTVCLPLPCHHVIDSWTRAEADVRSSFLNGPATLSISNYTLPNAGYFQGIFNNGNATLIHLKPPQFHYPVVFSETGLGNQTSWSATLNGITASSTKPDIVFDEPNGTYPFTIGTPTGFNVSPATGTITVSGVSKIQNILFKTPWTASEITLKSSSGDVPIGFEGNASVKTSTAILSMSGDPYLKFNVSEIGWSGVVNVTVPRSIVPPGASSIVYIDKTRDLYSQTTFDASNYYIYIALVYGVHSVELQFAKPGTPLVEYFAGVTLAGAILGTLFLIFRLRRKKRALESQRPNWVERSVT